MADAAPQDLEGSRRFWLTHAVVPAVALATALAAVFWTGADLRIADALFYDWQSERWVGAGSWLAVNLIHTGGRNLMRAVGAASLIALVITMLRPRWRHLRRTAVFITLSLALVPALVATLKFATQVDCPWDLDRYGGTAPYIGLLGDRSAASPNAGCFPGSHASSAFAWFCFYFALRERRPRAARAALVGALVLGTVFSLGQQLRGAHFLSHDLTSLALAWFLVLGLYRYILMSSYDRPATVTGVRWKEANGPGG